MTGKSLSTQQIAALWRAYKIRQTARFVARHCSVSQHTAAKCILNHNFAQRFAKLQAKANDILDDDQATSLANTLKPLANLRFILLRDALAHAKKKVSSKPPSLTSIGSSGLNAICVANPKATVVHPHLPSTLLSLSSLPLIHLLNPFSSPLNILHTIYKKLSYLPESRPRKH